MKVQKLTGEAKDYSIPKCSEIISESLALTPFTENCLGEINHWLQNETPPDILTAFGRKIMNTPPKEINQNFLCNLIKTPSTIQAGKWMGWFIQPLMITVRTSYHSLVNMGFVQLRRSRESPNECLIKYLYIRKAFRQKDFEYLSLAKIVEFIFINLNCERAYIWIYENNYLFLSMMRTLAFKLIKSKRPREMRMAVNEERTWEGRQEIGEEKGLCKHCFMISSRGGLNVNKPSWSRSPPNPKLLSHQHKSTNQIREKREISKKTDIVPNMSIPNYLHFKQKLRDINRVHGLRSASTSKQSVGWYSPILTRNMKSYNSGTTNNSTPMNYLKDKTQIHNSPTRNIPLNPIYIQNKRDSNSKSQMGIGSRNINHGYNNIYNPNPQYLHMKNHSLSNRNNDLGEVFEEGKVTEETPIKQYDLLSNYHRDRKVVGGANKIRCNNSKIEIYKGYKYGYGCNLREGKRVNNEHRDLTPPILLSGKNNINQYNYLYHDQLPEHINNISNNISNIGKRNGLLPPLGKDSTNSYGVFGDQGEMDSEFERDTNLDAISEFNDHLQYLVLDQNNKHKKQHIDNNNNNNIPNLLPDYFKGYMREGRERAAKSELRGGQYNRGNKISHPKHKTKRIHGDGNNLPNYLNPLKSSSNRINGTNTLAYRKHITPLIGMLRKYNVKHSHLNP